AVDRALARRVAVRRDGGQRGRPDLVPGRRGARPGLSLPGLRRRSAGAARARVGRPRGIMGTVSTDPVNPFAPPSQVPPPGAPGPGAPGPAASGPTAPGPADADGTGGAGAPDRPGPPAPVYS